MTSACMLSFSAMNRAEMSPVDSRSILTSMLGRVLLTAFMYSVICSGSIAVYTTMVSLAWAGLASISTASARSPQRSMSCSPFRRVA